jgi:Mce-associated membrane protein
VSDNNNTDVDVAETAVDEAELADTAADEATGTTESEETATPKEGIVWRSVRAARSNLGVILLAASLIASAGVAAWLYFNQYRPDQQTDAAASQIALDAAKTGTVALLSYSPESLDKDFAAAKSHLTGDFLSYYTQFTETIVTPAAQQKAVKTMASVVRAAVSELRPHSAVVLVFVNQNTTSKENPDGAFAVSSVKVRLTKIDGTWLISSFDPV